MAEAAETVAENGRSGGRPRPGRLRTTPKGGLIAAAVTDAAEIFRQALRESICRNAIWHLVQGVILIVAGLLSILCPVISSVAVVTLLGWLQIISSAAQAISLIGAGRAPYFWLQMISAGAGLLVLALSSALATDAPLIKGEVVYHERMALPQNALVELSLQDISRADAPGDRNLDRSDARRCGQPDPVPHDAVARHAGPAPDLWSGAGPAHRSNRSGRCQIDRDRIAGHRR